MEFSDRVLKCTRCGAGFVFTTGEHLFFHGKEFNNGPKHCKVCKAKRARGGSRVRGNPNRLLAMRGADHGFLQTDTGQAGSLPLLLQAAEDTRAAGAGRKSSAGAGRRVGAELNGSPECTCEHAGLGSGLYG